LLIHNVIISLLNDGGVNLNFGTLKSAMRILLTHACIGTLIFFYLAQNRQQATINPWKFLRIAFFISLPAGVLFRSILYIFPSPLGHSNPLNITRILEGIPVFSPEFFTASLVTGLMLTYRKWKVWAVSLLLLLLASGIGKDLAYQLLYDVQFYGGSRSASMLNLAFLQLESALLWIVLWGWAFPRITNIPTKPKLPITTGLKLYFPILLLWFCGLAFYFADLLSITRVIDSNPAMAVFLIFTLLVGILAIQLLLNPNKRGLQIVMITLGLYLGMLLVLILLAWSSGVTSWTAYTYRIGQILLVLLCFKIIRNDRERFMDYQLKNSQADLSVE